jgi:hypothetical protein
MVIVSVMLLTPGGTVFHNFHSILKHDSMACNIITIGRWMKADGVEIG